MLAAQAGAFVYRGLLPWNQPFPLPQPVPEHAGRHGPAEQEALARVTPQRLQFGPDGLGLDPLGDHLDPELVREVNGGPGDRPEA